VFRERGGSESTWAAFQVQGDGDHHDDRQQADLAIVEQIRRRLVTGSE
jgi:hypothetical protein